jgi:hypothetical protein
MLAFAESYRRKFLSFENKKLQTPPPPQPVNPPRKSPTARSYSFPPPFNHPPPPSSLFSPTHPIDMVSPTTEERTQLLPIEQPKLSSQKQNLSESPLTFGKKSSYGLFLPHNYRTTSPSEPDQVLKKALSLSDDKDEDLFGGGGGV